MADGPQQNATQSSAQMGFSLIEVVLTLVILGLLMGIVTTNMRGVSQRNAIKAERGQLALVIEDLRTISLYANRDLSLQAYLQAARTERGWMKSALARATRSWSPWTDQARWRGIRSQRSIPWASR